MTLLNQPFVFLFFINSTQTQEACLYPNKRTVGNRRSPHNQSGVNFPGQFQLKEGKEKSFCQQRVGGPEDEIKFHATKQERTELRTMLSTLFAKKQTDSTNFIPTTSHLPVSEERTTWYTYKCGAEYNGQWLNGQPQGKGKLISSEGKVFEGEWRSNWKAGCGIFVDMSSGVEKSLGWKVTLPSGPGAIPVDLDQCPVDPVSANGFQTSDLQRLFSKGDLVVHNKGDIILREGAVNRNLYFIKSGSVRIEKGHNQLMQLGVESIFGEYSLLDMQKITATVIAESLEVSIIVLSYTALVSSLQADPALSKRFNQSFARILSQRLRALDAAEDCAFFSEVFRARDFVDLIGCVLWLLRQVACFNRFGLMKFFLIDFPVPLKRSPSATLLRTKANRNINLQLPLIKSYSGALSMMTPGRGSQGYLSSGRFNDRISSLFEAWMDHSLEGVMQHMSRGVIFLDPFTTQGCFGILPVRQHLENFFKEHLEVTFTVVEVLPVDGSRFVIRLRISRPSSLEKIWAMFFVVLNSDGLVLQFEAFYDPSILSAKSEGLGSPSEFTDRDIDFSRKFELSSLEHVFQEKEATLFIKDAMPKQHCKAYLSSQHLCFISNIFGFNNKSCIPLSKVGKISKDDIWLSLKITFSYPQNPLAEGEVAMLELWFETLQDLKAFYSDLENLHATFSCVAATPSEEAIISAIEKKILADKQYKKVPKILLNTISVDQCLRIQGPSTDDPSDIPVSYKNAVCGPSADDPSDIPVSYKNAVCGLSVSGYPIDTHYDPETKAVVKSTKRQGDPICDQFVVDIYEDGVLFALADGCNWGWKPRNAAYVASRRLLEFLKSNTRCFTNAQAAALLCAKGFSQAQKKILEGHEKELWEVGTTTMLGGILMQAPGHFKPYVGVLVGVGDCKAFHFKLSDQNSCKVSEITIGSRSGANINDATDPGGRLGPQTAKGDPDLRNFDTWYASLDSGDLLMLCTDGVHDNLDPQGQGLVPSDHGLVGDTYADWDKNDPEEVEKVKREHQNKILEDIFMKVFRDRPQSVFDVSIEDLTTAVISYCMEKTNGSRDFMEKNPTKNLPKDYKLYPGKMDHITCFFVRAQPMNLRTEDKKLLEMVAPMSHPITGIQTSEFNGFVGFTGSTAVSWLKNFFGVPISEAEKTAQNLLTFNYLLPVLDDNIASAFRPDIIYELNVISPIMGKSDWEKIMQVAENTIYRKGDVIIEQGSTAKAVYHCIKGQCKVLKQKGDAVMELATINTFEIFGELNFLEMERTKTYASVVAHSDVVEVQRLSEDTLNLLCAIDKGIGGRFYHYLATIVARRLKKRGI